MADQEFSSPGVHMASQSSSGGFSHGPNDFGKGLHLNNVIYHPSVNYDNINNGFMNRIDEDYGSSAEDRADRYNDYYMRYNSDLFNSAKEYDMYMSNTAIQRQVEDLKRAGLNPIFASRLGGATYKGVNAPYLSISPASALNSFLDYSSSMYATDVNSSSQIEIIKMQNDSRELISQYEQVMALVRQGNLFEHENELVELKKDADRYLDSMRALDQQQLQKFGFYNQKQLEDFKHNIDVDWYNLRNFRSTHPGNFGPFVLKIIDNIGRLLPFTSGILQN